MPTHHLTLPPRRGDAGRSRVGRRLALLLSALSLQAAACGAGGEVTSSKPPLAAASASTVGGVATAAAPALPELLTAERLMAHVHALCDERLAGREGGKEGERLAADYVVGQLEAAGVQALNGGYRHPFEIDPGVHSLNVVGVVAGSGPRRDEHVVLGAHLDHLGQRGEQIYYGAEDNASGVAVVLEVAALLSRRRGELDRSLVVALFGAEEQGLLGAKRFVAEPPVANVRAMVNIDMIGRPLVDMGVIAAVKLLAGVDDHRAMGVLGTLGRPHFRALVDEACAAEGIVPWAPEDLPGPLARLVERVSRDRGDSFPFEAVGVPALFFGQGESDDYHLPSDSADKLDPEGMAARGRAIARVVLGLSRAEVLLDPAPSGAVEARPEGVSLAVKGAEELAGGGRGR